MKWLGLSPKARRNALRILPFGVIWLLTSQVFLISDYASAGGFANVPDTAITVDPAIYVFATLAVTAVGLLVGAVELLFLDRRFADRSLGAKLVGKTLFYGLFLALVVLVTFPLAAALEMHTAFTDPRVWERLRGFAFSLTSLGTAAQLTASLVASLFYAEISEHLGPHVLTNFLTGRYHTPREERRIFLFSDMTFSTQIAERLSHARYFELLRAYYDVFSDAVIDHGGQVYQYIGDEVVVSWTEDAGLRDGACIRCVLQMKQDLRRRAPEFEARFGVAPDFRAALQVGPVTTGEIGALKKEIVFTGDVLNQTARIRGQCAIQGFDVLVGGALALAVSPLQGVTLHALGDHPLRGKEQRVELFGVEPVWPAGPSVG